MGKQRRGREMGYGHCLARHEKDLSESTGPGVEEEVADVWTLLEADFLVP